MRVSSPLCSLEVSGIFLLVRTSDGRQSSVVGGENRGDAKHRPHPVVAFRSAYSTPRRMNAAAPVLEFNNTRCLFSIVMEPQDMTTMMMMMAMVGATVMNDWFLYLVSLVV